MIVTDEQELYKDLGDTRKEVARCVVTDLRLARGALSNGNLAQVEFHVWNALTRITHPKDPGRVPVPNMVRAASPPEPTPPISTVTIVLPRDAIVRLAQDG